VYKKEAKREEKDGKRVGEEWGKAKKKRIMEGRLKVEGGMEKNVEKNRKRRGI